MSTTDQIGFRTTKYTGELALRDASPSRAARFATIRYLILMRESRRDLLDEFTKEELKFMFTEVLPRLDYRRPEEVHLLWAYTEQAAPAIGDGWPRVHHSPLVAKVKALAPILRDTLVDLYREYAQTDMSEKAWTKLFGKIVSPSASRA